MNKLKKYFTLFLFFIFIVLLFKYNYLLNKSIIDSVNLWLNKIFPSLFIMFVLNDIIIASNILTPLNNILSPCFNKIFKTSGNSCQAFLLSMISGTPSSAFIIKEMLNNNSISLTDANKLISFTYFSNPLFLYNILSLSFNNYITIKIIIIHYFTNIIIGLIFALKSNKQEIYLKTQSNNYSNFFSLLPKSINKSLNTLLMILGTITFYMILTNLFTILIPLNPLLKICFKGILEITQSLNDLPTLNMISIKKEIIALSIISFGGLSIHTQVLSLIDNTKINYKYFFLGRILHVILSTTTYFIIITCFTC